MKKILSILFALVLIVSCAGVSVPVKAEGEEVTSLEKGFTNILFSNGYRGFCIDEDKAAAGDSGEKTDIYEGATDSFKVLSASVAESNIDERNISNKLKMLFTYCFEEIFEKDNGVYKIKNYSDVQSVVWTYSDGERYMWGERKALWDKVESLEEVEIPDKGYQIVHSNGDVVTFDFSVMKPENEGVQYFFAYKLEYYAGNSSPSSETINIVWDDADDEASKRPDDLSVRLSNGLGLTLNEANNWSATVENLPKENTSGEDIAYTWIIENLPEGYSVSSSITEGTVTTVTLSYQEVVPEETVEASVKVVWDDADDQDGKRPESLVATLSNGTEVTLNEENNWSATIDELLKNSEDGEEMLYTWTMNGIPEDYNLITSDAEGTETVLTYKHIPETIDLTLKFVWDDENNQDNTRPTSLNVLLNDEEFHVLTVEDDWTLTLLDLPKYESGEEIKYIWTIAELPEGYTSPEIEETDDISLTVFTSTYEPQEPVEPSEPGDSGEGGAEVQPSEPEEEPSEPQNPTNPSGPEDPTEPEEVEKEEMPTVPEEPESPQGGSPDTGDYSNVNYYLIMFAAACLAIIERMLACAKQK